MPRGRSAVFLLFRETKEGEHLEEHPKIKVHLIKRLMIKVHFRDWCVCSWFCLRFLRGAFGENGVLFVIVLQSGGANWRIILGYLGRSQPEDC